MRIQTVMTLSRALPLLALVAACGGVTIGIAWGEIDNRPHSGIDTFHAAVVNDPVSWSQLWAAHTAALQPPPPLPAVDFFSRTVIGVFLGSRPNACYRVQIDEIRIEADRALVYFSERHPRANEICAQVITAPAHIVTISKTGLPFLFIKTS